MVYWGAFLSGRKNLNGSKFNSGDIHIDVETLVG